MTDATAGHLITNGCRLRSLRSLRRTRLAMRAASAPWNVIRHPNEYVLGDQESGVVAYELIVAW